MASTPYGMEQCKKNVRHFGVKSAGMMHTSLIRLIGLQYRMMRCHLQNHMPLWLRVPFLFRGYNVFAGKCGTPYGTMDCHVMKLCNKYYRQTTHLPSQGPCGQPGPTTQCLCRRKGPCCCKAECFCRCSCLKCLLLRYCIYEKMANSESSKKIVEASLDHEQHVEINVHNTRTEDKTVTRLKRPEHMKEIKGDIEIKVKDDWNARVELVKKSKSLEGQISKDDKKEIVGKKSNSTVFFM